MLKADQIDRQTSISTFIRVFFSELPSHHAMLQTAKWSVTPPLNDDTPVGGITSHLCQSNVAMENVYHVRLPQNWNTWILKYDGIVHGQNFRITLPEAAHDDPVLCHTETIFM